LFSATVACKTSLRGDKMVEPTVCPVCGSTSFDLLITLYSAEVERLAVLCCKPNRHIILVPEEESKTFAEVA
jgi:hypothetical protein